MTADFFIQSPPTKINSCTVYYIEGRDVSRLISEISRDNSLPSLVMDCLDKLYQIIINKKQRRSK